VAKEKGVHAQSPYRGARGAGTEPRTYDCQDFVKAMLEKLKSYELKEDKDQSKHYQ
jgi:hypothetical protein